ncbi:MAG: hypothetical protein V1728_03535 [Candidatus Micrarchaeota archaeon]
MDAHKGQGASEYLVLLAVVLVVGMVALALLSGFTQTGGEAQTRESKEYWTSTSPFSAMEMSQQNSTFYLALLNNQPDHLTINNITLTDKSGNSSTYSPPDGVSLRSGQQRTLSFTAPRACDPVSYDYFEYNVVITYSTFDIDNKMQRGAKPLVGPCVSG